MNSDPLEFAWACGLFEGEGSVNPGSRGRTTVYLKLGSTDGDSIERFLDVFGLSWDQWVNVQILQPSGKAFLWFAIGKREIVEPIVKRMYPFLGSRRQHRIKEITTHWEW